MKKFIVTLLLSCCSVASLAQSENLQPARGITIEKEALVAVVEDRVCFGIAVELKSASTGVKITARDADTGRKIYRKRYPKSSLYLFSDGSVQVKRDADALTQLVCYKSDDEWRMVLCEKGIATK